MKARLVLLTAVCILVTCGWAEERFVEWIGDASGSGLWSDAANWYPPIVPNNNGPDTYDVYIPMPMMPPYQTVITLDMNAAVDLLRSDEIVYIYSDLPRGMRTLSVTQNMDLMYGALRLQGIRLVNDPTIRMYMMLNDSMLTGSVENQGTLNLLGFCGVGPLENYGVMRLLNGAVVAADMFQNYGTLDLTGGIFESYSIQTSYDSKITGSGKVIMFDPASGQNQGVICAKGGHLYVAGTDMYGGSFVNQGMLQSDSGSHLEIEMPSIENQQRIAVMPNSSMTLNCMNGLTNYFEIEVYEDGALTISGDENSPIGYIYNQGGQIRLQGGHLQAPSVQLNSGDLRCQNGTIGGAVRVGDSASAVFRGECSVFGMLEISPNGEIWIHEGVLSVDGPVMNAGIIHLNGGIIIPGEDFSDLGQVIAEPSAYRNVSDYNRDGVVNLGDYALFGNNWLWTSVFVN